MNKMIGNLIYVCKEIWQNIGIPQKASIILILLGGVIGTAAIIWMGSRPNWQVLYADLEPKSASRVYELVKDQNVPVQLKNSGKTILVPHQYVYDLRLKVAEEDIGVSATGTGGWELYDQRSMGLTEQQQRVKYQRAVQGELEHMISQMPGVATSRVMLAIPEKRPFVTEGEEHPTASVLIGLKPGHRLSQSQVGSIRSLVSSGVKGLQPNNVTIADSSGKLLARQVSDKDDMAFAAETETEQENYLESKVEEKAIAVLAPIVGRSSVVAKATVDIDYNKVDILRENYDSANKVLISEDVVTQQSSKKRPEAKGAAGTASNTVQVSVKDGGNKEPDEAQQSSTEQRKKAQYVVPKTTEKRKQNGFDVKKMSVAVAIGRRNDEPRSAEVLESYRKLVAAAVGAVAGTAAGNTGETPMAQVEIMEDNFVDDPGISAPQVSIPLMDKMLFEIERLTSSPLARIVLGVLLLGFLYRVYRRGLKINRIEDTELAEDEVSGEDVYNVTPGVNRVQDTTEEDLEEALNSPFELVSKQAEESPERVAGILESWLQEEHQQRA